MNWPSLQAYGIAQVPMPKSDKQNNQPSPYGQTFAINAVAGDHRPAAITVVVNSPVVVNQKWNRSGPAGAKDSLSKLQTVILPQANTRRSAANPLRIANGRAHLDVGRHRWISGANLKVDLLHARDSRRRPAYRSAARVEVIM